MTDEPKPTDAGETDVAPAAESADLVAPASERVDPVETALDASSADDATAEVHDTAAADDSRADETPVDNVPTAAAEGTGANDAIAEAGAAATDADVRPRLAEAQLRAIVEALVFASPEPLTPKTLCKLLNDEPKEDVLAAVRAVQDDYATRGGLHVVEVAGGYQITTRPEFHEWVRRLFHERTTQKLSVQSLETLAVVAYRQPVTAAEIGEIRGVNTSGVLSTLMERHLIKIVGRKNVIGRPFLYGTTKEFLVRFGLNNLQDLPKVEDMAAALGFEAPALLTEKPVSEDMLPLDDDPDAPPAS